MDCDHFMDQKNILKFIYYFMIIFLIVDIFKHVLLLQLYSHKGNVVILSLIIFVEIGFNMSIHINI
jgi:hypothetical protein